MTDSYVRIGFTQKAHGAQGEIKISVNENYLEDLVHSEVVFIPVQGKPLPFFVEGLRETNAILLKLEGIDSPADATAVSSKELLLRKQDVQTGSAAGSSSGLKYSYCEGFTCFDQKFGEIGMIAEVLEFPQQEMAVVQFQGNNIYIPLNEEFIQEIDKSSKLIKLSLPEGLLDI